MLDKLSKSVFKSTRFREGFTMSKVIALRPAPVSDIYQVSWKDEDGAQNICWVQARTEQEAEAQARILSLGSDVHVYRQNQAA